MLRVDVADRKLGSEELEMFIDRRAVLGSLEHDPVVGRRWRDLVRREMRYVDVLVVVPRNLGTMILGSLNLVVHEVGVVGVLEVTAATGFDTPAGPVEVAHVLGGLKDV